MGTKELEKKSSGGGLVAAWKQNPLVSTGLVLILMIVVQTAIMIYNFGEGSVGELLLSLLTNWLNILRNNAPVGIIALGMTFVIISGGIDLSVGSTLVAVGAMVMMVVDGSGFRDTNGDRHKIVSGQNLNGSANRSLGKLHLFLSFSIKGSVSNLRLRF